MKYTLFFLTFFFSSLNSIELKIASYNIENLFDMQYNGTEYKEYIPNSHNWINSILDKKLTNISEVICELNADIIGLQEVENKNALKLLQTSLKSFGCNYKYSAITHKYKSAIQIAILSKLPIINHKDIIVTKALGVRNILEAKFIINKNPLYIFINHWNSKHSSDIKRVLSARRLKKRLLSLGKNSEYIILGDFNTNYNNYRINSILNSVEIREFNLSKDIFSHYNLWLEEPIYKRWSYNFYGKKEAIDAIFIPYSLVDGKGVDYINNSFSIFKKAYLFHKRGYILRWKYIKGKHKGVGYSDHLAISARFSTKAYIKENSSVKSASIKELLSKKIILPIKLKKVKVIKRLKKSVYIKDKYSKDIITIFGINQKLFLGKIYNIIVYKRKFYNGKYEITDYAIIHKK